MSVLALALTLGGFGVWASTSELSGAVIAPGSLVVESSLKRVQHPTGGIVGEILVQEGSIVQAGDVVMRLDDTVTRSTLGVVRSQLDEVRARDARLSAERDDADRLQFPQDLLAREDSLSLEIALIEEELVGVRSLYEKRLVSISRLMLLLRDKAKLDGERGQYWRCSGVGAHLRSRSSRFIPWAASSPRLSASDNPKTPPCAPLRF